MSKQTIDHVNDETGWNITSPSEIDVNSFSDKIAGLNNGSLVVNFSASDTARTLSKSYASIDLENWDTLIINLASKNYGKDDFTDQKFWYKIMVNNTDGFYLPIRSTFTDINIALDGINTLDRIEITALHESQDYIWVSEIVLEKEDVVLDMLANVKEHIEFELNLAIGKGIQIGTLSGQSGEEELDFPNADYKEQYLVFLIDDGVNSEEHQIDDIDEIGHVTLKKTFDGDSLLNTYTNANIYLKFPVEINPDERNIMIPGIVVWGFVPTPIYHTGKLDTVIEAYNLDGSFIQRFEGQFMNIPVQIDCEARQASLLNISTKAIRSWLEKEIIWINGRYHALSWIEPAIELQPQTGIDIVPKVQYNINIETQESFANRETLAPAGQAEIDINVRR